MPTYKTGKGFKIEVDTDQLLDVPTDVPAFAEICTTSVSRALNEAVDTFFRLCDNGFSSNQITALDTQYDITVKGDIDDTTLQAILATEWKLDNRNRNVIKITDNFTGKVIEVNAPITAISDTREIETIIEFAMTFKFNGEPTIT